MNIFKCLCICTNKKDKAPKNSDKSTADIDQELSGDLNFIKQKSHIVGMRTRENKFQSLKILRQKVHNDLKSNKEPKQKKLKVHVKGGDDEEEPSKSRRNKSQRNKQ